MKTRPPNLIFFETHDDPITMRILAKLIPEFKKLGYDAFFDESPRDKYYLCTGMESLNLKHAQENGLNSDIDIAKNYMRKIAKLDPDTGITATDAENDECFKYLQGEFIPTLNLSKALASKLITHPELAKEFSFQRESLAETFKFRAIQHYIAEQLIHYNIIYQGIDDPNRPDFCPEAFDPVRDLIMATAQATATEKFFGRNGLCHVNGIQRELVSKLSNTKAYQTFMFFYLHSIPVHKGAEHKKLSEFEIAARAGTLDVPLGLIAFDGLKHTDEEIIAMILKAVMKKTLYESRENNTVTFFRDNTTGITNVLNNHPELRRNSI